LDFFVSACGFNTATELSALAPFKSLQGVFELGAARYGHEVWNSQSWKLPARLIADSSHLDLHFRLNDARLPIRSAGLDIDPGWMPWLGRVVTFHYGSGREPL